MSIVKLNNRSVKDITAFGSITSLGSLTHIATQTASSSASLSFTSGIDSTYKEYIFYFVNMHPSANSTLTINGSIDSGSNYNVAKTTTAIEVYNHETNGSAGIQYRDDADLAQGTGTHILSTTVGTDNDQSCSGFLHLFNPSSTTFVKHFIARVQGYHNGDYSIEWPSAGYFNTTSAIDAIQFSMSSGNIDSGQILLFGLN
jgi:hypothetical protein